MHNNLFNKGDIWMADIDDINSIGHEQKGYRPVLVFSNSKYNKISNTSICFLCTSSEKKKVKELYNTYVEWFYNDKKYITYVNSSQIRTLDNDRLKRFCCNIIDNTKIINKVNNDFNRIINCTSNFINSNNRIENFDINIQKKHIENFDTNIQKEEKTLNSKNLHDRLNDIIKYKNKKWKLNEEFLKNLN